MAVAESADAFDDMTHGENRMEATSEFELPDGTKVQVGTEGCAPACCQHGHAGLTASHWPSHILHAANMGKRA